MPTDIKQALDSGKFLFSAKELEGQQIPPDYEVEPLNGGDPLTFGGGSGMFRVTPKKQQQQEQMRNLGVVGGGLSAMLGGMAGGAGPVASTLLGIGESARGAEEQNPSHGMATGATLPLMSKLAGMTINAIPGGSTVGKLARAGVATAESVGQAGLSNWLSNKAQGNTEAPTLTAPDIAMAPLAGAGQMARDVLPDSYFLKFTAQMNKLLEDNGISFRYKPPVNTKAVTPEATGELLEDTAKVARNVPKQGSASADLFKLEIAPLEEAAAVKSAVEKGAAVKVPRTRQLFKQAQEESKLARRTLHDAVAEDMGEKQNVLRGTIDSLRQQRTTAQGMQQQEEISKEINRAQDELRALKLTERNVKRSILAGRDVEDFSGENLQKLHASYKEAVTKYRTAKDSLQASISVAEDASRDASDATTMLSLAKAAANRSTSTTKELWSSLQPYIKGGDITTLRRELVDGLLTGKSQVAAKLNLAPADVVRKVVSAFREEGGEEAVNAYRKLFFSRLLTHAQNSDTGTFEDSLQVMRRLAESDPSSKALGQPHEAFAALLANPDDTPAQVAKKASDFVNFFNTVAADAPGTKKSGWMLPMRQWVVFDLTHHVIGVPAAAAVAGGFSLMKAYRLPDLLALAAENPSQWVKFVEEANKVGPGMALARNNAVREILKTLPGKTLDAASGVWDEYRKTISSPKANRQITPEDQIQRMWQEKP